MVGGVGGSISIEVKPVPEKHQSPKLVTDAGIVMVDRYLQSRKQFTGKLVMALGRVMEDKLL